MTTKKAVAAETAPATEQVSEEVQTEIVQKYWSVSSEIGLGEPLGSIPLLIHRAMFNAKLDMPPVTKEGTLEIGGKPIPFTRIEDIRKALYPVLAKHGIMVYLHYLTGTDELQVANEPMNIIGYSDELDAEGRKTGGKLLLPRSEVRDGRIPTTRYWATVIYEVKFVYVGDGSSETVRVKGLAYDTNSDKAVGKATTAAVKRAFTETFDIVDGKEEDEAPSDEDERNRAATTDRRDPAGGDRGQQARAAAQGATATGTTRRSGPQRSATTKPSPAAARERTEAISAEQAAEETGADATTGEVPEDAPDERPEPQAPPADTALDIQKKRVVEANRALGVLAPTVIDEIATAVTGKKTRPEWITSAPLVKKLADELERRVAENAPAEYRDETPS